MEMMNLLNVFAERSIDDRIDEIVSAFIQNDEEYKECLRRIHEIYRKSEKVCHLVSEFEPSEFTYEECKLIAEYLRIRLDTDWSDLRAVYMQGLIDGLNQAKNE